MLWLLVVYLLSVTIRKSLTQWLSQEGQMLRRARWRPAARPVPICCVQTLGEMQTALSLIVSWIKTTKWPQASVMRGRANCWLRGK